MNLVLGFTMISATFECGGCGKTWVCGRRWFSVFRDEVAPHWVRCNPGKPRKGRELA